MPALPHFGCKSCLAPVLPGMVSQQFCDEVSRPHPRRLRELRALDRAPDCEGYTVSSFGRALNPKGKLPKPTPNGRRVIGPTTRPETTCECAVEKP
jgi:hypothetical protein